ncbi:hypothetical protein DPEC_G00018030 [Dallia pectoralis]|uniref:Uncharacterized protein n=1 Tax=Dallia pectoralis TaxID=75939 RepID=A0ACC2HFY6_DALPE|nr:hypothetical protein DPEC_G00018030 [Dallia pectoralis]
MLSVLKDYILEEVKNYFIPIQADETTDVSTHCQLVLVLRYIDTNSNIQEGFFEFITIQNATADTIATALQERLSTILSHGLKAKLIAQAYDGASVMRGARGLPSEPLCLTKWLRIDSPEPLQHDGTSTVAL